jgi:hypothetical protein
VSGEELTRRR